MLQKNVLFDFDASSKGSKSADNGNNYRGIPFDKLLFRVNFRKNSPCQLNFLLRFKECRQDSLNIFP